MNNNHRQEELLEIVARLTELYTSRESTSIPYDTARMLMEAALYCIKEAKAENDSRPLTAGEDDCLLKQYQYGYQLVVEKVKRVNRLYNSMIPNFQSYGNRCYYDTIVKGFPKFFLYYDARFSPQDHLLTLDYPVLQHHIDGKGIDCIEKYLYCVALEQQFLGSMEEEEVRRILGRYESEYEEGIFNICSPVLRFKIISYLYKVPLEDGLGEAGRRRIQKQVGNTSSGDCLRKCRTALRQIVKEEYQEALGLYAYLSLDLQDFVVEMKNACDHGSLKAVLPW